MSSQQTNLLPENASQNDTILPKVYSHRCRTTLHCLSSHGCAITIAYIYIYIYRERDGVAVQLVCVGLAQARPGNLYVSFHK